MLVVDADKRYTLRQIACHRWMHIGCEAERTAYESMSLLTFYSQLSQYFLSSVFNQLLNKLQKHHVKGKGKAWENLWWYDGKIICRTVEIGQPFYLKFLLALICVNGNPTNAKRALMCI